MQTIPHLSAIYFDIQPARPQGNMLSDMMASLFGGPPASGARPAQPAIKQGPPPTAPIQQSKSSAPAPAPSAADELADEEMD